MIGANRQPGTIGHQILVNLIECGFPGPVYPVNPAAAEVAGRPAVARVQDLPRPVDLAVIAVRPEALAGVIRDCAEAGVGAVVVVTADFPGDADPIPPGARPEQDITRFVRSHGMRMVGPTSMGVLSVRAGSAMHATFAPVRPPAGAVAMSSQSGPLGLAILDLAYRVGLGFSCFVSIGAAADVSSNDLLEWWEDDPQTSVVLLYLDDGSATRGTSRASPGGSARASRSSRSLPAATRPAVPCSPRRASSTPRPWRTCSTSRCCWRISRCPAGSRVAIVTNAMDPGVLAAAACTAAA